MSKATSYLCRDNAGVLRYIDPNDHTEINAHYGVSHVMAAMILYGKAKGDKQMVSTGYELLETMLSEIMESQKLPAYHFDFNNFAIGIVIEEIEDNRLKALAEKILIESPDSSHNTVNWLPMRIFVNRKRYELTGEKIYLEKIKECQNKIKAVINNDGSIEDRLPKGTSFNLQYDISTVALLQYISDSDHEFDIPKYVGFLLQCVAPDGDINYQGRGTNQVFAWGPWIYLLSQLQDKSYLEQALLFLSPRLTQMLDNDSMMLNNWSGKERHLWWDYHYTSVYIAHLLLWLIFAESVQKDVLSHEFVTLSDSGMRVYRTLSNTFVATFDGRKEYLAEHGPTVSAIYINGTPIVKGAFGPWRGLFGNKHSIEDVTILNYCGLYKTNKPKSNFMSRIKTRLHLSFSDKLIFSLTPLFVPINVNTSQNEVVITWTNKEDKKAFLNVPVLADSAKFSLTVDEKEVRLFDYIKIKNQYDWVTLLQSHPIVGRKWILKITL